MLLPLAYFGNPILRRKTDLISPDKIDSELKKLVEDMIETMKEHDGIGLAAPQIQKSISLFIIDVPKQVSEDPEKPKWIPGKLRVFINPKITAHSQETWTMSEGCLSIPKVYGEVIRPIAIKVEALDLEGKFFEEEFSWLEARAIMHENDHINGTLFIDRMEKKARKEIENELHAVKKKFEGNY